LAKHAETAKKGAQRARKASSPWIANQETLQWMTRVDDHPAAIINRITGYFPWAFCPTIGVSVQ